MVATPAFTWTLLAIIVLQMFVAIAIWRVMSGKLSRTTTTRPNAALGLDHLVLRLEGMMNATGHTQAGLLEDLRDDLAEMRADIEWLASDRMIAQAIELARTGAGKEEISQETGLAEDAVRAITLLRRH